MKNFAAVIGAVFGGYFGWVTGNVFDAYAAVIAATRPGHTGSIIMAFIMASFWGVALRLAVGGLTSRHEAAQEKVERVALKVERERTRTGKTPPSPFPAYQA